MDDDDFDRDVRACAYDASSHSIDRTVERTNDVVTSDVQTEDDMD